MSYQHIQITIDLNKIDESRAYPGKKGQRYYTMIAWANTSPDEYGNDFAVKPSASKEERTNKVKLPYIGNAKILGKETPVAQNREEAGAYGRQQQQRRAAPPPRNDINDEDVPF